MADQPDRQRLRPTVEGRARLLAAIEAAGPPHVVDGGALGEYAEMVAVRGQAQADAALPDVAAHLSVGCASCQDDLRELVAMAAEPDLTPQPHGTDLTPHPPLLRGEGEQRSPSPSHGGGVGEGDDSGIYAVDLPDPRVEEEAARRQRLRRIRDRLLIAAAIAILAMGVSLIGMAYLAGRQPEARLGLTPMTGRAAPSGMSCPASHPIKGNRSSMIYHVPGGEFYDATGPEDCFASPADAEAAGYRRSQR
jgi:hypothetical protein